MSQGPPRRTVEAEELSRGTFHRAMGKRVPESCLWERRSSWAPPQGASRGLQLCGGFIHTCLVRLLNQKG